MQQCKKAQMGLGPKYGKNHWEPFTQRHWVPFSTLQKTLNVCVLLNLCWYFPSTVGSSYLICEKQYYYSVTGRIQSTAVGKTNNESNSSNIYPCTYFELGMTVGILKA